jgi:predicted lysophospholipase L1 biosynthesis ABC-type transport system permease subunit
LSKAPTAVMTGAEDDGRRRIFRLLVGLLGWLFLIALLVYLARSPTLAALDVALFLVTVITVVTIVATFAALQLRSSLMRHRATAPDSIAIDTTHDTLGRPLQPPGSDLRGEIVLESVNGVRRYRRLAP